MYTRVNSGMVKGMEAVLIGVEVDASFGLPVFDLVGNMSGEVREARERVRIALKNIGMQIPNMRITVNLSPAQLRKETTAFDLPIAIGVLVADGRLALGHLEETLLLGELGLNGEVKGVRGVLPIVRHAVGKGLKRVIVPQENVKEAAFIQGAEVYGATHISEVIEILSGTGVKQPYSLDMRAFGEQEKEEKEPDFKEVHGQYMAKRAAEIAAAGFHHLFLIGPPGSGKTMIAKRITGILPPLSMEECMEISSVYSVAGKLNEDEFFVRRRPFLYPHHTVSKQAMAGGGRIPKPGLISLAHKSVLFLDEFPEFSREVIETLRQPIEDKKIQIARNQAVYTYPANFMLIVAANPCPCGYFPDRNKCSCSQHAISRYLSKISGPILDRIDLCCQMSAINIEELRSEKQEESSADIRKRVLQAVKIQGERFRGTPYRYNAELPAQDVSKFCKLEEGAGDVLAQIYKKMHLSVRGYHRLLKVGRTIADLEQSEGIAAKHLKEAACYRMNILAEREG